MMKLFDLAMLLGTISATHDGTTSPYTHNYNYGYGNNVYNGSN